MTALKPNTVYGVSTKVLVTEGRNKGSFVDVTHTTANRAYFRKGNKKSFTALGNVSVVFP